MVEEKNALSFAEASQVEGRYAIKGVHPTKGETICPVVCNFVEAALFCVSLSFEFPDVQFSRVRLPDEY
jgi:hypothetical protein